MLALALAAPTVAGPLAQLEQGGLDLSLAERSIGLLGIASMLAIAWLISYDRRRTPWRLVATGLALQAAFGFIVLRTTPGRWFFDRVGDFVRGVLGFVADGARFVFGNLIAPNVPVGIPDASGKLVDTSAGLVAQTGALFGFAVLPTIIFFSSLMSVLYYLGVMQRVIKAIAWVMQRTLGTSGAETLSASGSIFVGQTEAPLLIRPFVPGLTPSELVTIMVSGFAHAAIGVMVAYVAMLQDHFPGIAGHLLAATVMNTPAGLVMAKMICPESGEPATRGALRVAVETKESGVIEAAANGASVGLQLALNVAGMLIAFVALIAMVNFGVGWAGDQVGLPGLSLQKILGTLLRPLAWVMGAAWQDTEYVGGLIGIKTVLNEFVAYSQFAGDLGTRAVALQPRSAVVLAYSLLGFANFASIAIQIGGIGGLAPERRGDIARFGLRAMVAGNLAAFMSASLAGMLL